MGRETRINDFLVGKITNSCSFIHLVIIYVKMAQFIRKEIFSCLPSTNVCWAPTEVSYKDTGLPCQEAVWPAGVTGNVRTWGREWAGEKPEESCREGCSACSRMRPFFVVWSWESLTHKYNQAIWTQLRTSEEIFPLVTVRLLGTWAVCSSPGGGIESCLSSPT